MHKISRTAPAPQHVENPRPASAGLEVGAAHARLSTSRPSDALRRRNSEELRESVAAPDNTPNAEGLKRAKAQMLRLRDGLASTEAHLNRRNELAAALEKLPLFRGFTYAMHSGAPFSHTDPRPVRYPIDGSGPIVNALDAMAKDRVAHFPIIWGFRRPTDTGGLHEHERQTLTTYIEMFKDFQATAQAICDHVEADEALASGNGRRFEVHTPLILADVHAQHNNVQEEGPESYRDYYRAVQAHAEQIGLKCHWLSDILRKIGVTPEEIAGHGKQLLNVRRFSGQELQRLKMQARHMAERYPESHATVFSMKSNNQRNKAFEQAGKSYAAFRMGEGELVLPKLPEYFGSNGVVPVHVGDPASNDLLVRGLHIFSKDESGSNSIDIPWKNPEEIHRKD